MACTKVTRTNGSKSELLETLNSIYDNELKAEEAYAYFDIVGEEVSPFMEEFGDYLKGYGKKAFRGRVDDNGEPKLFYDDETKKHYFLDKNENKVVYPAEKRGLRAIFNYDQIDRITSRLALNYFKKSKNINFNAIKFEEGEKLPKLEDHIRKEILDKIEQLKKGSGKDKIQAKNLIKSLPYIDEYVKKVDAFYKHISLKRVDNDTEDSLQDVSETGKDPLFAKSSFEQDSKDSVTNNMKLRLSLLENDQVRDPVWNEPTFVSFDQVYSALLNNVSDQTALEGEDIFDLQRNKIKKISYKLKYLNQLLDDMNDVDIFDESNKNQFAQAFNLHKNNFLTSEITKLRLGDEKNPKTGVNMDIKEVSNSGSKASIVTSEWGNNFKLKFLTDANTFRKGAKEEIAVMIEEFNELKKAAKDLEGKKFDKAINHYLELSRQLGIELTQDGLTNYLDENGSKTFDDKYKKDKLNSLIGRTASTLGGLTFGKVTSEYKNPFDTQSIFKDLAKAEAFFLSEGSDSSIWSSGKNKWLYSYPSYISTRIQQWKKNPVLLQNWYSQSAYNKGSELAKYLLALDIKGKDKFGNQIPYEHGIKEERKRVSLERLDKLNLGVFNTFQDNVGNYVSSSDISFNDYITDNLNKILKNSYVRTTTPADKTTDLQLRTGFFVSSTTVSYDGISLNKRVVEIFFNYFNSEFNRMKEASAEVDAASSNPENLRIHYHYKAGSDIYSKNGNAFNSQYFPDLSFSKEAGDGAANNIKDQLYNEDGTIKHTADISANPQLKKDIENYIKDTLQKGVDTTLQMFLDQGIIESNDNGELENKLIDNNTFKEYLKKNESEQENAISSAASDFYINGLIQNIEYSKLFTGDVAFYKNMVDYKKRIPGTYTDGLQLRLKEGEGSFTAATINSIEIESPVYNKLVDMLGEEGAKPYKKINSADAQAWITPARWKFLLERLGKWTDKHDAVYKKMTTETSPVYDKEELKTMAQPLKGVYFYMNGKSPTYLKYSQAVLTKGLIKGTDLEKLYDAMERDSVDELITIDGFKVGSPTPTTVHDNKGKVIDNIKFNVTSLSNYGWKLQQDLPIKTFKETDVGSQIQKNIFAGLKFNGELGGFVLDGKETSGKIVTEHINRTVKSLIDKGVVDIDKEFGIGRNGKIKNIKGLYSALIRELEKRGGSQNMIDALNKQTTLYGMPQSMDKIISIYSSIMNDRLIKIKTNGGAFIQMSNFGIAKDSKDANGIIWSPALDNGDTTFEPTKYTDTETGRTRIKPGGILISGSFIAKHIPNYKKYTPEQLFGYKDENGNFVDGIIDKRILETVVGYRIPNQGLSSNDALEIVGILPESNGDTVVAYTGITTKTGSDFDIDKMFIMMANYTLDEESGKLKYTEYDPNVMNRKQSKEAIQNRLVELYKSVLTHPKVIKDVMKPVDIKYIEDDIKSWSDAEQDEAMYHFDQFNDVKLRYEFIMGKAGVGQEANALVDINRIGNLSLNKYYIGWGHSQENGKHSETIFDEEFAQNLSKEDIDYYTEEMREYYNKNDKPFDAASFKKSITNVKIGDSLTAVLNAFVDIAKDSYISRGNWTTSTTNIGNLLIRAGVHPLYVTSFMAQPIIKDYIRYQSSLESITNKNTGDIKSKFRRNLVLKKLKEIEEVEGGLPLSVLYQKMVKNSLSVFTDVKSAAVAKKQLGKEATDEEIQELIGKIKAVHNEMFQSGTIKITDPKYNLAHFRKQITEKEDPSFQLAVYDKFLELQEISKAMKENIDFSKLDTNGMGKNVNSLYAIFNLRQHVLNKEESGDFRVLNGLQTKLEKTTLGHYYTAIEEMLRIVQANPSLFPQGQQKVQDMFNTISMDLSGKPAFDEVVMTELEKNYYTYVMSNFSPFDLTKEESEDLLNEFPNEFKTFQDENMKKYFMLKELQTKRDGKYKFISLNNRKKSTSFEEKFTDSWRDMILDHPDFAEKLIKYSFATSGFRMNSNQFYTYIPHEYILKEDINRFIPRFSAEDQVDFIDKFYLNNTFNHKYVPIMFKNEMVAGANNKSAFVKDEPGKARFYVTTSEGMVFKLEGYNADNRAIYTRVDKLGKEVKGSTIVEYGKPFTKKLNDSDPEFIKKIREQIVLERTHFNPSFQLDAIDLRKEEEVDPNEEAEEIEDFEEEKEGVVKEIPIQTYRKVEDIKDSIIEKYENIVQEVKGVTSISEITNHSGGAYGADTYFDVIGREFGVTNQKHYREGKNSNLSQKLKNNKVEATILSKEEMDIARAEIEKLLGKKFPDTTQGNLQVRNYYQVKNSDAIFAVAPLDINKGFAATAVHGGTNTAVQLGIKLRKSVHVWDTTTEQWYKWHGSKFVKITPPVLTKDFAGVGTRNIESYNVKDKDTDKWVPRKEYLGEEKENAAKQAIRDLYQRTKDAIGGTETETKEEVPVKHPIEVGRFVKYKDDLYIVTQFNANGTVQIYNPKKVGKDAKNSKLPVSPANLTSTKNKGKIVTYEEDDYIVTPNNTIISLTSNKTMKWGDEHKSRKAILNLSDNNILAVPVVEVKTEPKNDPNKKEKGAKKESKLSKSERTKALWDKHSENFLIAKPNFTFDEFDKMPKKEKDKLIECYG